MHHDRSILMVTYDKSKDLNGDDPTALLPFFSTCCQGPVENRLNRIILYCRDENHVRRGHQTHPALQVIDSVPGLEVHTYVVPMREQSGYLWMDRDTELHNWKEGVEIMAGVSSWEKRRLGEPVQDVDELDSE